MINRSLLIVACPAFFFLAGCASTDPLTGYINRHGFEPYFPPTSKATVGDVYESPELTGQPLELVENILSESEREELMAKVARDVTLMNTSSESRHKIHADLFFVGCFVTELVNEGIESFKVSAGDATEYLMSRGYFERMLLPKLQDKMQVLQGAYIFSLLEVTTLEYEFYDEAGAKVNIQPSGLVAEAVRLEAGIEWKINERQNIEISSPRFIGFKTQILDEDIRVSVSPKPALPSRPHSGDASQDALVLIAQLESIGSDAEAATLVMTEVPRFGRLLDAADFVLIVRAACLTSDAYHAAVVERCAPYLRYPITADETRAILRGIGTDAYRTTASRALGVAGRKYRAAQ